jgi:nicotinamidase-related amidase
MTDFLLSAEPGPIRVDPRRTALVIIDMQRDFLEPGGFGETLGNDVSRLAAAVEPCRAVLAAARRRGLLVVHTREGHRPDLSDAPPAKVERGAPSLRIGAPGPMGRILIRGEPGHDIIAALYPIGGEPVIDKPGKGRLLSDGARAHVAQPRHREPFRVRRHHRGLRQHHRARGQ